MKQLKFLMIAFTLLTGISLTSCIGDSDPTVRGNAMVRVTNLYPYTFQMADGYGFAATNQMETSNFFINDIVSIGVTYNSDEQQFTQTNKTIEAQITFNYNLSKAARSHVMSGNGAEEPYENATVNGIISNAYDGLSYFDKNTLLIPVSFLAKDDLYKHSFTLVYDTDEVSTESTENTQDEDVLVLYLRHFNSEENPTESASIYKAFDITYLLATYKAAHGESPAKIRVLANKTNKSGSNKLEDAQEKLQSVEVEYKKIFEDNNN